MSKPVLGLLLGAILGAFDGLTAILTPEAVEKAGALTQIVIGSTFKGLVAGVLIGFFAKRYNSLPLGLIFGLLIAALFAFIVAAIQPPGHHYYFQIMLPGSLVGLILGFATQKYGKSPQQAVNARN